MQTQTCTAVLCFLDGLNLLAAVFFTVFPTECPKLWIFTVLANHPPTLSIKQTSPNSGIRGAYSNQRRPTAYLLTWTSCFYFCLADKIGKDQHWRHLRSQLLTFHLRLSPFNDDLQHMTKGEGQGKVWQVNKELCLICLLQQTVTALTWPQKLRRSLCESFLPLFHSGTLRYLKSFVGHCGGGWD